MYDAFYPGQVWLDTNGNRIQAHGGSLIYLDGVYYWYGENKEKNGQGCGHLALGRSLLRIYRFV